MSDSLVIASKVKSYIKDEAGLNCSSSVITKLTEVVKRECDRAINNARGDKRKTVMDRDFD
jgi:histone H3/H4